MAIWYILWSFGINFLVLESSIKENLATLPVTNVIVVKIFLPENGENKRRV
jgi:hypothetical protein